MSNTELAKCLKSLLETNLKEGELSMPMHMPCYATIATQLKRMVDLISEFIRNVAN